MRKEWLLGAALIACLINAPAGAAVPGDLVTTEVRSSGVGDSTGFDGVVEAVRQTVVAAQVSGAVVALDVKVGDVVKAGQVLAKIDAHAAEQSVAASDAQVQSARASLEVATKEFERQKQLFDKKYTSQAALERAEAQFKATQAQVSAQIAQAGAARTQSGFFVVKAPYGGVVAEVPVALGDMAMPGRPLLTLYDPAALRVTVAVPQTAIAGCPPTPQSGSSSPDFPVSASGLRPRAWNCCRRSTRARTRCRSDLICRPRSKASSREPSRARGCPDNAVLLPVSTCRPRRLSGARR